MPIRLMPIVWTVAAVLGAGALWYVVDEIGDRREAQVNARWEARDREVSEKAKKDADDAEEARRAAERPGSFARLRADWCRDCGGAQ